jgi:lysophospholipase L1-like esterase
MVQVLAPAGFVLRGAVLASPEDPVAAASVPPPLPAFSALAKLSEDGFSGRALQVFGPSGASGGAESMAPAPKLQDLVFSLGDGAQLLGVDLRSGRAGLLYDELGLNGAQLLDLEKWNPELRKALLARSKPDLVILAYGTNDEGMGGASVLDYQARMKTLLRKLREESQAPILVIGPLDRFGNRRRSRPALKVGALRVIGDMKQACLAEGCAFWDAREAMGGYGSIRQWRRTGLAKRDLVHLTARGYELLGDRFCDQLLAAYEFRNLPATPANPVKPSRPNKRGPSGRVTKKGAQKNN